MTTTTALGPEWPAAAASAAVVVTGLLLALVTGVLALMNRRLPRWVLVPVALVELALVVLTVQCLVAWVGGTAPVEPVVFLAYLVVCLVAAPATYWWGKDEPGRWGPGVVLVAGLVIPVLMVRLQQVWTGHA